MMVNLGTFLLIEGLIAAGVIIWRLMKKIERQESMIVNQQNLIETVSSIIEYSDNQLREIDNAGVFAADDEIGFFFKNIKVIQSELNQFIIKKTYG